MNLEKFQIDYFPCVTGRFIIGNLIFMNSFVALAKDDSPDGGSNFYLVEIKFNFDNEIFSKRIYTKQGQKSDVFVKDGKRNIALELIIQESSSSVRRKIMTTFTEKNFTVVQPTLLIKLGHESGISLNTTNGPIEIIFIVTQMV